MPNEYFVVVKNTPGYPPGAETFYAGSREEAMSIAKDLLEELEELGYTIRSIITPTPDMNVSYATDENGRTQEVEMMRISETLYLSQQ